MTPHPTPSLSGKSLLLRIIRRKFLRSKAETDTYELSYAPMSSNKSVRPILIAKKRWYDPSTGTRSTITPIKRSVQRYRHLISLQRIAHSLAHRFGCGTRENSTFTEQLVTGLLGEESPPAGSGASRHCLLYE